MSRTSVYFVAEISVKVSILINQPESNLLKKISKKLNNHIPFFSYSTEKYNRKPSDLVPLFYRTKTSLLIIINFIYIALFLYNVLHKKNTTIIMKINKMKQNPDMDKSFIKKKKKRNVLRLKKGVQEPLIENTSSSRESVGSVCSSFLCLAPRGHSFQQFPLFFFFFFLAYIFDVHFAYLHFSLEEQNCQIKDGIQTLLWN